MEQKIKEIVDHVSLCGGRNGDWYCGITSDVRSRLFEEHGVLEKGGQWIFRKFENSEMARAVEKYFLENLGFDGGAGGGDYSTVFVYVYKKTANTIE